MPSEKGPGYHLASIPRGEMGELSKLQEELAEAMDAKAQGSEVMVLVELSDLLGAVEAYLRRHHPSLSIDDLLRFSSITQRAFNNGHRTTR